MSKLPQVSGTDAVRALLKAGFRIKRQHGSHIILRRDDPFSQTVVQTIANWIGARCERSCARQI
jgi:predicted RNA binding protein YcfA (HicA-like mRNA interferase family)